MPRTIRFHLDENCSKAIADGLRRRGIDITTTPEAGLMGVPDDQQAAYGLAQGRVIFTKIRTSSVSTRRASRMRGSTVLVSLLTGVTAPTPVHPRN